MKLIEDSSLAQRLLEDVGKEIELDKNLPHVTELIYCLTRSYLNRFHPLPPTPQETLLFAVGVGLEKRLLVGHRQQITGEKDGIHYATDFLDYGGLPGELKTTRISAKTASRWLCVTGTPAKAKGGSIFDMPETWRKQILAYLYCNGATEGTLGVLFLMGNHAPPFPSLRAWHIEATPEELEANWQWLLERKEAYLMFVEEKKMPPPYHFNLDWECKNCRYKVFCEAKKAAGEA